MSSQCEIRHGHSHSRFPGPDYRRPVRQRFTGLEPCRATDAALFDPGLPAKKRAALAAADAAARGSLESMQRRYELGAAGYIELLVAEQQSQQTRIDLIEAKSRRLINSAALYQAMDGGPNFSRFDYRDARAN